MTNQTGPVVNVDEVEERDHCSTDGWGGFVRKLTPSMRPKGGSLGVNHCRVPQGHTMCPFHSHEREDEVFFILSGRGVLRYGEELREIRAGDCISCPAGTKTAHQLANPFKEDLVYLSIGTHDQHEVCSYPDNGKIMVRSIGGLGFLNKAPYLEGEPTPPRVLELAKKLGS